MSGETRMRLPSPVVPTGMASKRDKDIRCCVVCSRVTSTDGKRTRMCLVTSCALKLVNGDTVHRWIDLRHITEMVSDVGNTVLLLKIDGQEDLLLQELRDERNQNCNPPQKFSDIKNTVDKVRVARRLPPVGTENPTAQSVKSLSPRQNRKKKDPKKSVSDTLGEALQAAQMRAKERKPQGEAAEGEGDGKDKDKDKGSPRLPFTTGPLFAGPPSPGAESHAHPVLAEKPPPPPGPPPGRGPTQGVEDGTEASKVSSARQEGRKGPSPAVRKLGSCLQQLEAEHDLVQAQIDERRRELSTLTAHSKLWQEQLAAQQEAAVQQQKQFGDYMKQVGEQYSTYIDAVYEQQQRAAERRKEYERTLADQNDAAWREIMGELLPEEDWGSSDDDGGPRQQKQLQVQVHDEAAGEQFSFPADESYVLGLPVATDPPTCVLQSSNGLHRVVNTSALAAYSLHWVRTHGTHCVSLWSSLTGWSFSDAVDFWTGRQGPAPSFPLLPATPPPPLEYIPSPIRSTGSSRRRRRELSRVSL